MSWLLVMFLGYNGLTTGYGGPLVAEFATREACEHAAEEIRRTFPDLTKKRFVCVFQGFEK